MGKKATTIVIQIRHPPKLPEQMSAGTELPGCCFPVPPASRSVGRNSILGLLEVLCPAVMEAPWSQGTLPEEGVLWEETRPAGQGTASITYGPTGNTEPNLKFQR